MKAQLWKLDPGLPVVEASTMDQRFFESVSRPRFFLRLALTFAGMALLLAGVGVYGAAAYWVTCRRRELGIRLALGATPRRVLALVVGRSARLAACGSAIGLAASLGVTSVLSSMLFETSPRDPAVLAGVAGLVTGLALAACYVRARRAPSRTGQRAPGGLKSQSA